MNPLKKWNKYNSKKRMLSKFPLQMERNSFKISFQTISDCLVHVEQDFLGKTFYSVLLAFFGSFYFYLFFSNKSLRGNQKDEIFCFYFRFFCVSFSQKMLIIFLVKWHFVFSYSYLAKDSIILNLMTFQQMTNYRWNVEANKLFCWKLHINLLHKKQFNFNSFELNNKLLRSNLIGTIMTWQWKSYCST